MKLEHKEIQLLCDLLGEINYFGMMAYLTRNKFSEEESREKAKKILIIYNKMKRELEA